VKFCELEVSVTWKITFQIKCNYHVTAGKRYGDCRASVIKVKDAIFLCQKRLRRIVKLKIGVKGKAFLQ